MANINYCEICGLPLKDHTILCVKKEKEPITTWYKQKFEYNHYESGHSEAEKPKAHYPEQEKSWGNEVWKRKHAYLVNGKVVE